MIESDWTLKTDCQIEEPTDRRIVRGTGSSQNRNCVPCFDILNMAITITSLLPYSNTTALFASCADTVLAYSSLCYSSFSTFMGA